MSYHVFFQKQMIQIRLSANKECFYDLVSIGFIGDKKNCLERNNVDV